MSKKEVMDDFDEATQTNDDAVPVKKAKPAKQDRTTLALLLVAGLVATSGMGFAAGRVTAPSTAAAANANNNRAGGGAGRNFPSLAPGQTFNTGQFGTGGTRGVGGVGGVSGGVTGTVQSIDASTMTVQLANGTTVTVDLTGSTTYHGETTASSTDIKTGTSVTVQIDTTALAAESPVPGASGGLGGRNVTAKDVLITKP